MNDALTLVLELAGKFPSQYINMPFDSAVFFNGELVWFGTAGIYEETGSLDGAAAISAWVDTPLHDFGRGGQTSIEAFRIAFETADDLSLTLYGDENESTARTFTIVPVKTGQVQQEVTQTLQKYLYGKARYWKVRVANVDGGDFSLDELALAPVFLKRRSQ